MNDDTYKFLIAGVGGQGNVLIAQLIGQAPGSLEERVLQVMPRLQGQYAVVAVSTLEPDVVVAFRQGPPLLVGVGDGENMVASDVTAVELASTLVAWPSLSAQKTGARL